MTYTYLACPYSHPDKDIMERRFRTVTEIAGELLKKGEIVFSPITHFHPIAMACALPTGWEFWKRIDEVYIGLCEKLRVLHLPGWETSTGVLAEIKIAKTLGKPIVSMLVTQGDLERWGLRESE